MDTPINLTVLSGSRPSFAARLIDLSGAGARVLASEKLPPGTLVRLDAEDTLLLGEVCYAEQSEQGYCIGVLIEHSLCGLTDLVRLRDQLAGEVQPRARAASLAS